MKSWNEYFLDLAKTCASRSNCIRAQVGAVIVGEDKKIKATGYNGKNLIKEGLQPNFWRALTDNDVANNHLERCSSESLRPDYQCR